MASLVKAGYWFCGPHSPPLREIPSKLFTHLYAGFAKVNPVDGHVTLPIEYSEDFEKFTEIVRKHSQPVGVHSQQVKVKTLLSIGGEGSAGDISAVMKDENKRAKFVEDSIHLARKCNFDGLDLCWLYPSSHDKHADLVSFLNDWRAAVKKDADETTKHDHHELLLTAAVFRHPAVIHDNGYSFKYPYDTINEKLDWINVMAIDFYNPSNSWENTGPVHAWLTQTEEPDRCGSDGIGDWIDSRVDSQKLVLCLSFYGYEWILDDPNNFGFFAKAKADHPANTMPMTYRTIKPKLQHMNEYESEYDNIYIAAYAHNKKGSWIGYEDERSISGKVNGAIPEKNLRGYVAWDVGADDKYWTLSRKAEEACKQPPTKANP